MCSGSYKRGARGSFKSVAESEPIFDFCVWLTNDSTLDFSLPLRMLSVYSVLLAYTVIGASPAFSHPPSPLRDPTETLASLNTAADDIPTHWIHPMTAGATLYNQKSRSFRPGTALMLGQVPPSSPSSRDLVVMEMATRSELSEPWAVSRTA